MLWQVGGGSPGMGVMLVCSALRVLATPCRAQSPSHSVLTEHHLTFCTASGDSAAGVLSDTRGSVLQDWGALPARLTGLHAVIVTVIPAQEAFLAVRRRGDSADVRSSSGPRRTPNPVPVRLALWAFLIFPNSRHSVRCPNLLF